MVATKESERKKYLRHANSAETVCLLKESNDSGEGNLTVLQNSSSIACTSDLHACCQKRLPAWDHTYQIRSSVHHFKPIFGIMNHSVKLQKSWGKTLFLLSFSVIHECVKLGKLKKDGDYIKPWKLKHNQTLKLTIYFGSGGRADSTWGRRNSTI